MNSFTELEPWHKVQVIILLTIVATALCKLIDMLSEWWKEYKQQKAGIEKWEEEQHNKRIGYTTYDSNGNVVNLDERIKNTAAEIRQAIKNADRSQRK